MTIIIFKYGLSFNIFISKTIDVSYSLNATIYFMISNYSKSSKLIFVYILFKNMAIIKLLLL
jgi:hypothetical protein